MLSTTPTAIDGTASVGSAVKTVVCLGLCHMAGRYDALLADRKRDLLGSVDGTIVEIGPGTGTNFRYYPRGMRWIGIEPNPYMHPYLRHAGIAAGIDVDVRESDAETMGLPDGSVDVVVTTAVLCSVHDQAKTLQEIRRVLKLIFYTMMAEVIHFQ